VEDSKGGKVTYRVDKFANLHVPAGKISFSEDKLRENLKAILGAVLKERPATLKGVFIKSITLCTTMGPGIKLQVASATLEAKS
jgi:large subunit ribosomal protein L1